MLYRVHGEERTVLSYNELIEANSREEAYDIFIAKITCGKISGVEDHYGFDIKVNEIKDW